MATYTVYLDPIDGLDANDGSTPALAVQTFKRALEAVGNTTITETADTYTFIHQRNASDLLYVKIVKGVVPVSKRLNVEQYCYLLEFQGINDATIAFVWPFTSTATPIIVNNLIGYNNSIHLRNLRITLTTPASTSSLFTLNTPGTYGPSLSAGRLYNCSINGNFTWAATASGHVSNFMQFSASNVVMKTMLNNGCNTFALTDCVKDTGYLESGGILYPELSQTLLGKGPFLPPPNGNYNYDPQVVDFVAEGWINDATYGGGTATIQETVIFVGSGTGCRVLGPVLYYPNTIKFSGEYISKSEDTSPPPGDKDVVDSTPGDSTRTIEVRSSSTPFLQTDVSPSWVTIDPTLHTPIQDNYVQFRVTLISNGV